MPNKNVCQGVWPPMLEKVTFGGSGKFFIHQALQFFKSKGIIQNKNAEVIVPQWIGTAVYEQVLKTCMPAFELSERSTTLLLYHQYGFPQKLDEVFATLGTDLVVIEDCAHSLATMLQPMDPRFFCRVFSLNKFIQTRGAIGACQTNSKEFEKFIVAKSKNKGRGWRVKDLVRTAYDFTQPYPRLNNLIKPTTELSYRFYGHQAGFSNRALGIFQHHFVSELDVRSKRYNTFFDELRSSVDLDWYGSEDLAPYLIPLPIDYRARSNLQADLHRLGMMSDQVMFDVERNMIKPRYVGCLRIFIHSGIPEAVFERALETIKGYRNEIG